MLEVNNINVFYGKVQALFDVSVEVGEKEIVSLIGANGAGKTTLMKTIMGVNQVRNGSIFYKGENISNTKVHKVVKRKIVYVPEGREIFSTMTVEENMEMGAFSIKLSKAELSEHLESMYVIFPRLKERRRQIAGSLSGGEQQMLAIARGLMSDPELLMLDEPSLGLAPVIVDDLFDVIVKVNQARNIPIFLVEQNAYMAMSISARTYVLEVGKVVAQGSSKELMDSPEINKAYLGGRNGSDATADQ